MDTFGDVYFLIDGVNSDTVSGWIFSSEREPSLSINVGDNNPIEIKTNIYRNELAGFLVTSRQSTAVSNWIYHIFRLINH